MENPVYASRQDSLGFAARTRKNLSFVRAAFERGEDVHLVTQLVNSMLGLVIFPWERQFSLHVKELRLDVLHRDGWPVWGVELGSCRTLGQLIKYLRNGTAHSNIIFSSGDRELDKVRITIYNKYKGVIDFRASMQADLLYEFCLRFIRELEATLG